jgi:hypothetical protein
VVLEEAALVLLLTVRAAAAAVEAVEEVLVEGQFIFSRIS